ncbi:MAG TPA: hypothetical protein VND22_05720 [Actinomycetota bacterium]|nr:hypothetical protein [Actinomycetota bacterium]
MALDLPACPDLLQHLGLSGGRLVTGGQQIYPDYGPTVIAKLEALSGISRGDLSTCFFWNDTVRSGSDRRITTIVMPGAGGEQGFRVASSEKRNVETRFVPLDPAKVEKAFETLRNHVTGDKILPAGTPKPKRASVLERLDELQRSVMEADPVTLAEFSCAMTSFLLQRNGLSQQSIMISSALNAGVLTNQVNEFLRAIDVVVRTLNEAVGELRESGIDPILNEVEDDYLPLFYSCDKDGVRLRLHSRSNDGRRTALAECHCGAEYSFDLGMKGEETIGALEETGRWSVDVCLPVFQNDLMSGVVAGSVSADYGRVLTRITRMALGKRPVPSLLPPVEGGGRQGTLLFRYLFEGVIE